MLRIDNLTFAYQRKGRPVLDGFSLDIGAGGVYGLLGRNGAGKSTLLYLISGVLTPSSGKVMYRGVDTRLRLPETLSDIFIVPEEFTLPRIPLRDYVKANAPFYPRFSDDDMRRHLEIFDMDPDLNLGALSMGQKKKAFMSIFLRCSSGRMRLLVCPAVCLAHSRARIPCLRLRLPLSDDRSPSCIRRWRCQALP